MPRRFEIGLVYKTSFGPISAKERYGLAISYRRLLTFRNREPRIMTPVERTAWKLQKNIDVLELKGRWGVSADTIGQAFRKFRDEFDAIDEPRRRRIRIVNVDPVEVSEARHTLPNESHSSRRQ